MFRKLQWCLIEVVDGHWLEVSLQVHRWKWGISVELFTCWCSSAWRLEQAPSPWVYQDHNF